MDNAISILEEAVTQMSQDSEWCSMILEPPKILGGDDVRENRITIRLQLRTEPGQQWLVARELRRRLKRSLDQAEISRPVPQHLIWVQTILPAANTAINYQDATGQDR